MKRGSNLLDSDSVNEVIANQNWSEGYKKNAVDAYQGIVELKGLTWSQPCYYRIDRLSFISTEKEIHQLISRVGSHISAFLQLIKETAIRSGEAWQLKWNFCIKRIDQKISNMNLKDIRGLFNYSIESLLKYRNQFTQLPLQNDFYRIMNIQNIFNMCLVMDKILEISRLNIAVGYLFDKYQQYDGCGYS